VAVDSSGSAVLGGFTEAGDLPGGGARYGQRSGTADAFVAKLAADGRSAAWVRFLGGSGYDQLAAMAMDAAGNIYAGGIAGSGDFPGDDYSGEDPGAPRGFATKISGDGATVLSSRLLGYYVAAMAVDGAGALWLTGTCCSGALGASASALEAARNGYQTDAYLVQLGDAGPPAWASYIGGSGTDQGTSISATADGVVLAGLTQSFDFPMDHAAQYSLHQNPDVSPILADAFAMRFGSAAAGAPVFAQQGVTNAASYKAGEAAPGAMISIFGDDLATVVRQAGALPLPAALGGTSVTVNGVAAPLYYVSPSQVNAQVPFETPAGTAQVQVSRGGTVSPVRQLAIAAASPGLFVALNGFAAINSASTYVRAGDWITMYATGLGVVNGTVGNGQAPGNPPPQVKAPVTATLGGMTLTVTWAGLAPGYAGLYQINAALPAQVGSGFQTLPLAVSVGGETSNTGKVGVWGQ
jgi:uncharacterized protein (TIGR03437 family)